MKALLCLIAAAGLALSVNAAAADPVREAPGAAIDRITLIYLNHDVYPSGSVECVPKVVGSRSMIGCWNMTLGGSSSPHIWIYDSGVFKSVNGSARQLAEGKFSNEPDIAASALPLPADIDVGAALSSFKKS